MLLIWYHVYHNEQIFKMQRSSKFQNAFLDQEVTQSKFSITSDDVSLVTFSAYSQVELYERCEGGLNDSGEPGNNYNHGGFVQMKYM